MNPPASQQPARPATLTAPEASRVLGEGSDAAETREAAYAEAIGRQRCEGGANWLQEARAAIAWADAERNEAYARGYQTAREHWKARAESAEAEVERMRKSHGIESARLREAKESLMWETGRADLNLARAESAERARDAALAEVTGLRDRIGRVEALHQPTPTVHGPDYCQTCSESASEWVKWPCAVAKTLAVPVTGDTEDASPAAEDAPPFVRKIEVPGERVEGFGFRLAPEQQRELDEQLEAIAESRRSAMRQAHDYVIGVTGAASPTEQAAEGGAK